MMPGLSKKIVVSQIQVRLAMELAAQKAAEQELSRQIQEQLPIGSTVEFKDCDVNLGNFTIPIFDVAGVQVEFVD